MGRTEQAELRKKLHRDQELLNPCLKEHKLSLRCLDENNYDKEACQNYFENYKQCKYFWADVTSDRRQRGIKPALPPPEERARIKEEYLRGKR